jgi:hypothetical protein
METDVATVNFSVPEDVKAAFDETFADQNKIEPDTDHACAIVESVINRTAEILQPPHWLAEVAAVLARISPQTAVEE